MNKNKLFRRRKEEKEKEKQQQESILAKDEWGKYIAGVGPKPTDYCEKCESFFCECDNE